MRPGLVIGARHVVRYTVPVHQIVPDLLPALAEFRRGQPVFATGFMVGLMEARAWRRSIRTWNPAR
jgi:predicted thioesterase